MGETIMRICIMRDGPCPHGMDCPYVGDGPLGYPCKEGWRTSRQPRTALREATPEQGERG